MKMQRIRCDSQSEAALRRGYSSFLSVCLWHYRLRAASDERVGESCTMQQNINGLWRRSSVKLFAAAHIFHVFIYFVLPLWQIIQGGHRVPKIESNPPDVNLLFFSFLILTIAPGSVFLYPRYGFLISHSWMAGSPLCQVHSGDAQGSKVLNFAPSEFSWGGFGGEVCFQEV